MAVTLTEAHYETLRRSMIKIANGRHQDKRLSREELVTTARAACDPARLEVRCRIHSRWAIAAAAWLMVDCSLGF
jgi:hypothetical protein